MCCVQKLCEVHECELTSKYITNKTTVLGVIGVAYMKLSEVVSLVFVQLYGSSHSYLLLLGETAT